MVGLLHLKDTYSLSNEALLERWLENVYWQTSCRMLYLEHELRIHPSSLSRYLARPAPVG